MAERLDPAPTSGSRCPHCQQLLTDELRYERATAADGAGASPPLALLGVYCSSCGAILALLPDRVDAQRPARSRLEVADPADPASLAGEFQLRCRELVDEVQRLGFAPGGWVRLINDRGGVDATKHLLAEKMILPVTRWLVARAHPELTMEHEVGVERWRELFSDEERAEATRRLEVAREQGPRP